MTGVVTRAPSRVTPVSMLTMSRSMRGRSLSLRHADDILLRGDLVVGAGVAEHPGLRPHHPPRVLLQRIEIDAILQHHSIPLPVINAGHTTDHRNALSRRGPPWQAWRSSLPGSFPWPHPARLPPTSAAPSASCTRAAASSFRIHGTWAARAICRGLASRPSPRPAPATRIRWAIPTARNRWTWCSRITASWPTQPTFR